MSVEEILLAASEQGVHFYFKNEKLAYRVKKGSISDELKKTIVQHKNEIKHYIQSLDKAQDRFVLPPLRPVSRSQPLPLSFAQQRLWFIDQLEGSLQYIIQGQLMLEGCFDEGAFRRALECLMQRHEILRTRIKTDRGVPYQVMAEEFEMPVQQHDLATLNEATAANLIRQLKLKDAQTPFDLAEDLMLRVQLLHLSQQRQLILYTTHHIASDGWSSSIFARELTALYQAFSTQQENPLPAPTYQYADYAAWQRSWLEGETLDKQMAYWTGQLQNLPEVHNLPLDNPRPEQQRYSGRIFSHLLEPELTANIKRQCELQGLTLFMFLETAFALFVGRFSGAQDVVIGTPTAGRTHRDLEGLIGFFINTLVLRTDLSGNPSFEQLLTRNKRVILDAFAYQHTPFEMLVEALRPERNRQYNPLFQILFVVQNSDGLDGLSVDEGSQGVHEGVNIRFDLALHLIEIGDRLAIHWSYQDDLFNDDTIARMARNYGCLLESLCGELEVPSARGIDQVHMLNAEERELLLVKCNQTQQQYPQGDCLHQWIEQQVALTPDATAVIYEDRSLSFAQLNSRANQLAHHLIAEGITRGDFIGLSIRRSLETMVSLLGIMKAGAAYIPLDPEYPAERLSYMVEDAGVEVIISTRAVAESVPEMGARLLCLDDSPTREALSAAPETNPDPQALGLNPHRAAYIIYTSGSTGRPKGVVVEHHSLCNFVATAMEAFIKDDIKGAVVSSPLAFDATVQSLYLPLCAGRFVELLPEGDELLPALTDYLLDDEHALLFKLTPSHLQGALAQPFVEQSPAARHVVVVAGEPFPESTLRRWQSLLPSATFINEYGPTEATVGSCIYPVRTDLNQTQAPWPNCGGFVPIGRPLGNVTFYVLDPWLEPVPLGAVGELYIGGAGLAREYLNRPDLTRERFIANPFVDEPDARLYKTGDLVRYVYTTSESLPVLAFAGRTDNQIKIRGYRIELGEIEAILREQEGIHDAVVICRRSGEDARLLAYLVPTEGAGIDIDVLKAILKTQLPGYMLPSAFVSLRALPLTPSGKVDRQRLPDPDVAAFGEVEYEAPEGERERILVQLWAELLDLPPQEISREANFFALGGHSLLVMKLVAGLQDHGWQVGIRAVFDSGKLAELATHLETSSGSADETVEGSADLPDGCERIHPGLLPLIELTQAEIDTVVDQIEGGSQNIQNIYPLLPLQEGIFFHHLVNPERDPYVLDKTFRVASQGLLEAMLEALSRVVERHDILRTAIVHRGLERPLQVVLRRARLTVIKISETRDMALDDARQLMKSQLPPIALSRAPIPQIVVAEITDGAYLCHFRSHHIVADHVGNEVLWQEVEAVLAGLEAQMPPAGRFADYVATALARANSQDARVYFRQRLGDIDEPCLPFGLTDIHHQSDALRRAQQELDGVLARRTRQLASELSCSPATLFHAAWALVVGACCDRHSVVFGTVLSGRMHVGSEQQRTLGLFMNTLPLRLDITGTALAFVEQVNREVRCLLEYEQTALTLAQASSGVAGDVPLFSALLNYRHSAGDTADTGKESHAIQGIDSDAGRTNYPFSLAVSDRGDGFYLKANALGVDAGRLIDYTVQALDALLTGIETKSPMPVGQISVVAEPEVHDQCQWGRNPLDSVCDKLIHQLFEQQVQRTPDKIAALAPGGEGHWQRLSYAELNARANRLAHFLIDQGVVPEARVGLCLGRSVNAMVALLAVLKSGAAYVPLDPEYPRARLAHMLGHSGAHWIITESTFKDRLPLGGEALLCLDEPAATARLAACDAANPVAETLGLSPEHPAYIIYTSGSTGLPKGVVVSHRSVSNFLQGAAATFLHEGIAGGVVSSPLAFDATVQSLYVPLCAGRFVKLWPEDESLFRHLAEDLLYAREALLFKVTPTHLQGVAALDPVTRNEGVRHVVVVAGEPLSQQTLDHWRRRLPDVLFINEYGPTEATVGTSVFPIREEAVDPAPWRQQSTGVPIGRPLPNLECYVLGRSGQLLPQGTIGELYIGGRALARAYHASGRATAEKFVPHPLATGAGERLYRTGDLVRRLDDGLLLFVGRVDQQVKVRGLRIELGEIEHQLLLLDGVSGAVVDARCDRLGDTRLVAYVCGTTLPTQAAMVAHLSAQLPGYMVPAAYVTLAELPRTPSGKIDRASLPAPDIDAFAATEYVAPESEDEHRLVAIWSDLLELTPESISVEANFFALGGHSLLIVGLLGRLQQQGYSASVGALVAAHSLREMAALIDPLEIRGESDTPVNAIPPGSEQITPGMLNLVLLSQAKIDRICQSVEGGAGNIEDIYPLAPLQQGVLFHHLLDPSRDPYVIGTILLMEDQRQIEARLAAMQMVIDRHDSLRTAVLSEGLAQPVQVLLRRASLQVTRVRLPEAEDPDQQLEAWKRGLAPLDVTRAPLMRVFLVTVADRGPCYVYQQTHHLICDHVGSAIIRREIDMIAAGHGTSLESPPRYRPYIAHTLAMVDKSAAADYFRTQLGDVDGPTLPFGLGDVHTVDETLERAQVQLPDSVARQIRALCRSMNMSPASIFHLAWARVVGACSGRQDVVFGTVLSGRLQGAPGIERLVGLVMNTLPVRIDLRGLSVRDALRDTDLKLKALLDYELTPLTEALSHSSVSNDVPLFSALLNYRHSRCGQALPGGEGEKATVRNLGADGKTNYPFELSVSDWSDDFSVHAQLPQSIGAERVVGLLLGTLTQIVDNLVTAQGEASVSQLLSLPEGERRQLALFNDTAARLPNTTAPFVHLGVAVHRECRADAVALVAGGQHLTYAELDDRVEALAKAMALCGIAPESRVALCLPRTPSMLVAILATLRCGAAYVPMDPQYPSSRLAYMIGDSQAALCVVDGQSAKTLATVEVPKLNLDLELPCEPGQARHRPSSHPDNAAYMIYTSGSTGQPKGVVVSHRSLYNLCHFQRAHYQLNERSRSLQFASFSFDAATWDWGMTLLSGGILVLPDLEQSRSLPALGDLLRRQSITYAFFPPALLALLDPRDAVALETLTVGGESPALSRLKRWAHRCRVFNAYGPTENTVVATCAEVSTRQEQLHIGTPIENVSAYVLDADLQQVPIGAEGELYLAGGGLARGYWGRAALTAEHFLPNPFAQTAGERLYRTGDLVKMATAKRGATLSFVGRSDQQIKVRGFRIELGEVEQQLQQCDCVAAAAAVAVADSRGSVQLVAFAVVTDTDSSAASLAQQLRRRLPDHALPNHIELVAQLPLTANDKVDRKALQAQAADLQNAEAYRAPETAMERQLAALWAELLGRDPAAIGIDDNFFALGGHSLLVMSLHAQLQQQGVDTSVRLIMDNPRLKDLAAALEQLEPTEQFSAPANGIPDRCQHITPDMLPLVTLGEADIAGICERIPGGAENIQDIYPLAPLQEGILFHHLMNPQADPFLIDKTFVVEEEEMLDRMLWALQQVVDRHDILRTAIVHEELPEALQVVLRQCPLPVHRHTYTGDGAAITPAYLRAQLPPMVLRDAPLLRVLIVSDERRHQHYILLQFHHIISDHVGDAMLRAEMSAFVAGKGSDLPEPVPYREFVAYTQMRGRTQDAAAYFRQQLGDVTEPCYPFDQHNVHGDGLGLKRYHRELETSDALRIRAVARSYQVSPATLFHAAWALVVGATCGRDDVVFGTVLSGRLQNIPGADRMLGLFINTLPLRVRIYGSVEEFIAQIDVSLRSLLEYELTSLSLAQRSAGVRDNVPLFSALLNYRHSRRVAEPDSEATETSAVRGLGGDEKNNYPISLSVSDWGEDFSLDAISVAAVAPERLCSYVLEALDALLQQMETDNQRRVQDISPVTPESVLSLLPKAAMRPSSSLPTGIHTLVEEHAQRRPDATALVWNPYHLSYGVLDQIANEWAQRLQAQGVGSQSRVGLCLTRSPKLLIAMLAVLKSGAAYVPIDPDHPEARNQHILRDARVELILLETQTLPQLSLGDAPVVNMDESWEDSLSATGCGRLSVEVAPSQPACVLYTSGSTGRPKGVLLSHASLRNRLDWWSQTQDISSDDVFCQKTRIGFVDHVAEFFQPLSLGLPLVMLSDIDVKNVPGLHRALNRWPVSRITLVPSLLNSIMHTGGLRAGAMRAVYCSGEALQPPAREAFAQCFPNADLWNVYGSTEMAADVSAGAVALHQVSGEDYADLGTPVDNHQLLVLDQEGKLVAPGVAGELCVAGVGLAQGYFHRAGETARCFVPNPFANTPGERLYRTGDRVKLELVQGCDKGQLRYVGRSDFQAKIRGFRIEPGEIEQHINRHQLVAQSLAVVRQDDAVEQRLVAYIVREPADSEEVSEYTDAELRRQLMEHLQGVLPDYMRPSAYVILDALPLNANGKVDRSALPAPDMSAMRTNEYVAPDTDSEVALVEIWSELLGLPEDEIGTADSFFQLGGHSLLAMKVVTQIKQRLDVTIALPDVFRLPTVGEMAAFIDDKAEQGETQEEIRRLSEAVDWDLDEFDL
ncbi:amino acid adenylation domain-containing protein [Microbulbifer sp. 2201CG32-9]|uniref:amino acid adenylation domain-containing protein n=1 Tax=Microbulbifer sp. 2201CG32-9 TaxID=3232309 RepID=UPI00345B6613